MSDHSQIAAWFNFKISEQDGGIIQSTDEETQELPKQLLWQSDSRERYQQALQSEHIQTLINSFVTTSNYTFEGCNDALKAVNNIFLESSKLSLRVKHNLKSRKHKNK